MRVSVDKIEAIAPDQASLAAAVKIKPSSWPLLALDSAESFAWGECQGSGSTPYRACLQIDDLGYKCTCPSRKFPCKHALSLMLLLAKSRQNFSVGDPPDWVREWAGRRRGTAASPAAGAERKPGASLAEAVSAAEPEARDEKAEARAVQQRERLKAQREELILKGLDELDLWIADQLNRGLAAFMANASQGCRALAQRLVDAKAPGVASWVDGLPSRILALPDGRRHSALITCLGELHLFAEAYRRKAQLPEDLREDVRRLAGWTVERQSLLEMPSALRITADWLVTGTHSEIQPDKLRRIETWLIARHEGCTVEAVLIDFVPVGAGAAGSPFLPGEKLRAQLVFYPSALPLRALIAQRFEIAGTREEPACEGESLVNALDRYRLRLAVYPWLAQWPMTLGGVTCENFGENGLWLLDGELGLPMVPSRRDEALALAGVGISTITGLWDGYHFSPMLAETSLGRWVRQ